MFLQILIIILGQCQIVISSELRVIRVTLEFSEYKNEKMLKRAGGCCEKAGYSGILCADKCKTWFELCFTTYPYNGFKKCVYSANTSVIAIRRKTNFRNGEKLSSTLTNPISFEIKTPSFLQAGIGIHIKAWHNKTGSKQHLLIDEYQKSERFFTKYYGGNDLNIFGSKTSLKFKMRINCTNDFLSSSCDPLCSDPVQIKSHFICKKSGKKGWDGVCMNGWSGPGCNIDIRPCKQRFKKIGCFKRTRHYTHIMPDLIINDRDVTHANYSGNPINWTDYQGSLSSLACRCSTKAKIGGYQFFSIGFYGECFAGRDLTSYKALLSSTGEYSSNCVNGKYELCSNITPNECAGKQHSQYVYLLNFYYY